MPNMPKCRANCYWRTWIKWLHKLNGSRVLNRARKPVGTCTVDITIDENGKCLSFLDWDKEFERNPE